MENVNENEKAVVIDEQLENVSGGVTPDSLRNSRCSVCGKLTPNLNLIDHHLKKVCKSCLQKNNNR